MDNLLEALKNGSAFNVNRERKDGRKRTPRAAGGKLFIHHLVTWIMHIAFWVLLHWEC